MYRMSPFLPTPNSTPSRLPQFKKRNWGRKSKPHPASPLPTKTVGNKILPKSGIQGMQTNKPKHFLNFGN